VCHISLNGRRSKCDILWGTMSDSDQDRFAVDHMLVRLGKYLRVAGFDAVWEPGMRTQDFIVKANSEGRMFLTANQRIRDEYPPVDRLLLLEVKDPADQFRDVMNRLELDPTRRLFSRCIRCNVDLEPVADKEAIRDRVHPNVYASRDRYFTCPRCGTVFWHGSHVRNTCRKLGLHPPESA
jgi:uncharacterized protein with PIN domain